MSRDELCDAPKENTLNGIRCMPDVREGGESSRHRDGKHPKGNMKKTQNTSGKQLTTPSVGKNTGLLKLCHVVGMQ